MNARCRGHGASPTRPGRPERAASSSSTGEARGSVPSREVALDRPASTAATVPAAEYFWPRTGMEAAEGFGAGHLWAGLGASWPGPGAPGLREREPRPAPASRPGGGASPLLRRLPAFAHTGVKDFAPSSKAPSHAGGGGRWGWRCWCSSRPVPRSPLPCCCQIRSPRPLSPSPGSGTLQKALLPADKLGGGPSASWVSRLAAEQGSWLTAARRLGRSQLTVVCSPGSPLQQDGPMRSCTSEAAELQGLTASGSAPRAAPPPRPACTPPLGSREFHLPALRACVL